MGRMLDALKRAERAIGEPDQRLTEAPAPGTTFPTEGTSPDEEEIPFIEVGPRKSMEASRSVLASAPHASALPTRVESLSPAPQKVQFRALPGHPGRASAFAPELVAFHAPEQSEARQYRTVLEAVRNAASDQQAKVLLFTASRPRVGNTTALLNLAIAAAREGRERVLVVDADLHRPAVAERLGLPAAPGLREVLAGTVQCDRAVQPTEQPNLYVLTAGASDGGFSSTPQSEQGPRFLAQTMRSLLRQLRMQCQFVFVDGPPREERPDGMLLDGACDALFVVLPESEVETPHVDALLQRIPSQGGRLAGCILVAGLPF